MKKMINALKNNHGDGSYIALLVVVFWLVVALLLFINFAGVVKAHSDLSNAADKLMRSAELSGRTDLNAQIEALREDTGLDFFVSWEGTEYISGTQRVQLNSDIQLHLWTTYEMKLYNFPTYELTLNVRRSGTSEFYYK